MTINTEYAGLKMDELTEHSFVFWDEENSKVIILNKPKDMTNYYNTYKPETSFMHKLRPYFGMYSVEVGASDSAKYGVFSLCTPGMAGFSEECYAAIGFDWYFISVRDKEDLPEGFRTALMLMGIE